MRSLPVGIAHRLSTPGELAQCDLCLRQADVPVRDPDRTSSSDPRSTDGPTSCHAVAR
jgi:hypothetical protein